MHSELMRCLVNDKPLLDCCAGTEPPNLAAALPAMKTATVTCSQRAESESESMYVSPALRHDSIASLVHGFKMHSL